MNRLSLKLMNRMIHQFFGYSGYRVSSEIGLFGSK